ncbi:MAG: hypothetical protein REI09_12370 [Candidatus Dactylopiibacterium sp.]|nr:hypothetical protein [Candidatus Dactylopiibacterium sp.]
MCTAKSATATTLHDKLCHATRGIPCKTAHAVADILELMLGRRVGGGTPSRCQHGGADKAACGCGGAPRKAP